ncbi:MAG: xanthine dehydrogenase family protein subunit M [Chloroflexi bacterium]|jgi:carbon-monoxide dehydrogenase medium subunit|nr:xanthine dehydrogenase family protein subunit M [Chloroflexota bacterium]
MIADFEYFAPKTVDEALSLLSQYKEEAKIIAGGQSMLVVMKRGLLTTEYLIDIKGIAALDYIKYDEGEGLRIGALTIHRAIEKSPVILKHFRVLSEMERNLATIQTRNWGTIGGNLCHGDPAGDPAPVLIALNAKLKLASLGRERIIEVEEFSKDYLEVALEPDEMLTEIQVPTPPPHTGTACEKLMVMKGDMGIVGAAVSITLNSEGRCKDARIALSSAASVPLRAREAEKKLIGRVLDDSVLIEAGDVASTEASPPVDVHGSAEYRREMVRVFMRRAATKALESAKAA